MLEGVYVAPQNKEESRKNVEEVLRFISSRHIRMPHISARGKPAEKFVFPFVFFAFALFISKADVPNLSVAAF